MLVAISLDENNQIYHVAIKIVDLENDASWEQFMKTLRVIREVLELAFISNRCTSIQKFIYRVFSSVRHGLFFYHLQEM